MGLSRAERHASSIRPVALSLVAVTWFALVVPIGARAAGQLVTLVDSSTSHKARVDGLGRLAVLERPVGASPWSIQTNANPIFDPPSGTTTLTVGSLTLTNEGTDVVLEILGVLKNGQFTNLVRLYIPGRHTVHLDFPQPLVIAPGGSDWTFRFASIESGVYLTGVGYSSG